MRTLADPIRRWYEELPRVHPVRLLVEGAVRFFRNAPRPDLELDVDRYFSGRFRRLERRMLWVRAGAFGLLCTLSGAQSGWPVAAQVAGAGLLYILGLWRLWRWLKPRYKPVRSRWVLAGWDAAGWVGLGVLGGLDALEPLAPVGVFLLWVFLYVFYAEARLILALSVCLLFAMLLLPGPHGTVILLWAGATTLGIVLAHMLRRQWRLYAWAQYQQTSDALRSNLEALRRSELERLDGMKRQFITVLSHELRTPITPISSALEMMQPYVEEHEDLRELWSIAAEAAARLNRLVADYTQLAELMVNEDSPTLWEADVGGLACGVLERTLAASRTVCQMSLSWHLPEAPLMAYTHPPLLEVALEALLRRALGVPQEGVQARFEAGVYNEEEVYLQVWDSFTLLSESDIEALNDLFGITAERAYFTQGSGLELVLVRYIIERLGGHWEIQSHVGTGTRITLYLPRTELASKKRRLQPRLRFAHSKPT